MKEVIKILDSELIDLVNDVIDKGCKMQNIELKAAQKGYPKKLYDTLSGFSNQQNGGILIFGIDQDNDFNICGVYDPQDLQVKVTEQANQMSPIVRPLFSVAKINDKVIVSAEIAECDVFEKPCFYMGTGRVRGSYIRAYDSDIQMTEYEVYSYEAFRKKFQDELRGVLRADRTVLNDIKIKEYFYKVCNVKENLAKLSEEQILKLQGIIFENKPTLAGMMVFGAYPQAFFPQLCITAVVVPGTQIGETGSVGERFIDNKRIEGTIPQMFETAVSFVRRNMKTKTIVNADGKRDDKAEYPMIAVRELILNALIHRDYSIHTDSSPIRLMMFEDRIEIENPGGLYGRLTLDNLGKIGADTRNPYIAGILEILISTENRFSGIPTVYLEMEKAGLPKPLFENNRGTFKVTLYNDANNINNKINLQDGVSHEILNYCKTPKSRTEIAEEFDFKTPSYMIKKYIDPLIDNGLLEMTLPNTPKSKNQKYRAVKY